jgi:hypothetical protein
MTVPAPEDTLVGEWVSVKDAAARLGITERSVFRRLARGHLNKRTLVDGNVMVLLTSQDTVIAQDMTEAEEPSQPPADASAGLALHVMHSLFQGSETFRTELRERDDKIASMAEEIGRLRADLAWHRRPLWKRLTGQAPS